jgi:hypothetical protein
MPVTFSWTMPVTFAWTMPVTAMARPVLSVRVFTVVVFLIPHLATPSGFT